MSSAKQNIESIYIFYKTNENNFDVELFCIIGSLQNETFDKKMYGGHF